MSICPSGVRSQIPGYCEARSDAAIPIGYGNPLIRHGLRRATFPQGKALATRLGFLSKSGGKFPKQGVAKHRKPCYNAECVQSRALHNTHWDVAKR